MIYSEQSQYYEAFRARLLSPEGLPPERCRCHGGGWILSDVDTWHRCPDHYAGQRHPEDSYQNDMEALDREINPQDYDGGDEMAGAGLTGDEIPF